MANICSLRKVMVDTVPTWPVSLPMGCILIVKGKRGREGGRERKTERKEEERERGSKGGKGEERK